MEKFASARHVRVKGEHSYFPCAFFLFSFCALRAELDHVPAASLLIIFSSTDYMFADL